MDLLQERKKILSCTKCIQSFEGSLQPAIECLILEVAAFFFHSSKHWRVFFVKFVSLLNKIIQIAITQTIIIATIVVKNVLKRKMDEII